MLEYEKKIMLTADEYNTIGLIRSNDSLPKIQTNYYFDTDDLSMNDKGITCRIRAKDGKFIATIKNHGGKNPDCSVEDNLVEMTEFDTKIFDTLRLRYQGELVTRRASIHKDNNCEVVIDKNTYGGVTDFELEIEYCEGSEKEAQALLESIAEELVIAKVLTSKDEFLNRVGQCKSKSQRFFERIKKYK